MNYEEQKRQLQQNIFNRKQKQMDEAKQKSVIYSSTNPGFTGSDPATQDQARLKRGCGCRRG